MRTFVHIVLRVASHSVRGLPVSCPLRDATKRWISIKNWTLATRLTLFTVKCWFLTCCKTQGRWRWESRNWLGMATLNPSSPFKNSQKTTFLFLTCHSTIANLQKCSKLWLPKCFRNTIDYIERRFRGVGKGMKVCLMMLCPSLVVSLLGHPVWHTAGWYKPLTGLLAQLDSGGLPFSCMRLLRSFSGTTVWDSALDLCSGHVSGLDAHSHTHPPLRGKRNWIK